MIESRKNRHVKDIRRLQRSKGDHALLEGPHLVKEALAAGLELELVLATPEFVGSADRTLLTQLGRPPLEIAPNLLAEITDADSPRGILALAHVPRGGCDTLPERPLGLYLFVVGLQDPGNLGAIARAAEAAGATGMAIAPASVSPNHPRALRASAGSLLRLPVAIDVDAEALQSHLDAINPTWVALSPDQGDDVYVKAPSPPLVLAVGAERGLPGEIVARCSAGLRIPMVAPVDSLNAAVAVALALFEIRRQSQEGGRAPPSPTED